MACALGCDRCSLVLTLGCAHYQYARIWQCRPDKCGTLFFVKMQLLEGSIAATPPNGARQALAVLLVRIKPGRHG